MKAYPVGIGIAIEPPVSNFMHIWEFFSIKFLSLWEE
jgi:hypothetical protein